MHAEYNANSPKNEFPEFFGSIFVDFKIDSLHASELPTPEHNLFQ